jgi:dihydrofolate reductase
VRNGRDTVSERQRAFTAALQMSLDGYIQGAGDEVDWIDSWNDALDLVPGAEAAVIGGGTYPGYEQLWDSIAADPRSASAMLGRAATDGEVEYARWTQRTPHYVLSTSMEKVNSPAAHLVRDISELRSLKEQPGGPFYVIGGAVLVSSLMNEGLIDELRLIVHPSVLGGGKALFAGVRDRRALELVQAAPGRSGRVVLTYRL